MNKEQYEKMPKEEQWKISKSWLDMIQIMISARMALMPLLAAVSAALLIVATFNQTLIPLDNTIRIIVSILLLLIPFSLYFYNEELKSAMKQASDYYYSFHTKAPHTVGIKSRLANWMPDIGVYVLGVVALLLIAKIWGF